MLVLASQSPRRAEILRNAGIPFIVRVPDVDETVLGADTTVVLDGEMMGKPADEAEARCMLERLSGRRHEVLTGIAIVRENGAPVRTWAATSVWFATMTAGEIDDYVASGEPMDKAGAYAIQGLAS